MYYSLNVTKYYKRNIYFVIGNSALLQIQEQLAERVVLPIEHNGCQAR